MKKISILLGLLIVIAFLAGCGQKEIQDTDKSATQPPSGQETSDMDPLIQGEIDNSLVDDKEIDIGTPY